LSMETPTRRSRRLAGEDSGVKYSTKAGEDTPTRRAASPTKARGKSPTKARGKSPTRTKTRAKTPPRPAQETSVAEAKETGVDWTQWTGPDEIKSSSAKAKTPADLHTKVSQEEADAIEAKRFYTYAGLVFVAIAILLYMAPPAPAGGACDEVGIWLLVKGATPASLARTLQTSWMCAEAYNSTHPEYTLGIICALYIGLQSFAIPGPIVLSVLSGALYGFWGGQLLIAVCVAIGTSICFMLSKTMGRGVLRKFKLIDQLDGFRAKVEENRRDLLTYMLLTRVTPVPNVLVNVASPLVGVPLWVFAVSTPIGQFPLNALHVTSGFALASAASGGGAEEFQRALDENKFLAYCILGGGTLLGAGVYLKQKYADGKGKKGE